ncbi:MAG: VCBS repeat-containing protein [Candidatus Hydrogenedentes bacterium]|nr:VCBS repeat-containing protein [Candidatus Hydrogenedentota bacterium]
MNPTRLLLVLAIASAASTGAFPAFQEHVINPDAGTGLAITVADVNNDGKPDIVGVSSDDVAWYENPTWERHLIADTIRNSNVCIAAHDIDGDGIPEFALGADWQFNNTESGGALFLLSHQGDVKQPWKVTTLVEEEPTLHRIQWADLDGDGRKELVVAPLKGRGSTGPDFTDAGVKLYALFPGEDPLATPWREEVISTDFHLVHNLFVHPPRDASRSLAQSVTFAAREGLMTFGRNREESPPYRASQFNKVLAHPLIPEGAGEVKSVEIAPLSGQRAPRFLVGTIEPWHGHQAVVYLGPDAEGEMSRFVLDDQLKGGHAVWFEDFDRDGAPDMLVGFREKAGPKNLPGLNIYQLAIGEDDQVTAEKHIIDDGGMATEDALAADMNGDGWPDVVAYGRATKNIKYYENLGANE